MIHVRYAKSAIECEEGMNHLWIRLAPPEPAVEARVQISLPPGLHRSRNLSDLREDSSRGIVIPSSPAVTDLFVEIFTQEPVACGEYTMTVEMYYKADAGMVTSIKQQLPLTVISEEESGDISTDEEVVHRVKELQLPAGRGELKEFIEYTPAKLIRLDSRHVSELEKQYRVEGVLEML